jgi:hypothetical protein
LRDYSEIGAELRLAAAAEANPLPGLAIKPRRWNALEFLWRRVAVPRFALAGLVALVIASTAAVSIMRAQARPLWFEFGIAWQAEGVYPSMIAKAGYDDLHRTMGYVNGQPMGADVRINVLSIAEDNVTLRVRARGYALESPGSWAAIGHSGKIEVPLAGSTLVHYKPGEVLPIPIEGGGTLYLRGDIEDQQPKIAFHYPLEPKPGEFVVRWPVLTKSNEVLGQMIGATAIARKENQGISIHAGQEGNFLLGLHPFPGAVEGKLEWGSAQFRIAGQSYTLTAAAPMTGGDQPRPVWVRIDPPEGLEQSLGALVLPQ